MVAVTIDTRPRRRSAGPERHLTPVPDQRSAPAPLRVPVGTVRVAPATYRLRRTVAVVVVAVLAVVTWAVWSTLGDVTSPSGSSASASVPGAASIVVAPGDTFWSIASRIQPRGDVRPLVDRLVAAHGGAMLRVGERIPVPTD